MEVEQIREEIAKIKREIGEYRLEYERETKRIEELKTTYCDDPRMSEEPVFRLDRSKSVDFRDFPKKKKKKPKKPSKQQPAPPVDSRQNRSVSCSLKNSKTWSSTSDLPKPPAKRPPVPPKKTKPRLSQTFDQNVGQYEEAEYDEGNYDDEGNYEEGEYEEEYYEEEYGEGEEEEYYEEGEEGEDEDEGEDEGEGEDEDEDEEDEETLGASGLLRRYFPASAEDSHEEKTKDPEIPKVKWNKTSPDKPKLKSGNSVPKSARVREKPNNDDDENDNKTATRTSSDVSANTSARKTKKRFGRRKSKSKERKKTNKSEKPDDGTPKEATALDSFKGGKGELSFKKGATIVILKGEDADGRYYGSCGKKEGYFPSYYVTT
eukprot:CAMPEP_0174250866 /NCGR_PEP_ID=MMETSP0439-20130205/892_1 /TAXON_ID=0 /ORGANISM="Stereomyxa ramosa, Strain Chinc5" /LENGTH=375 /DNA_ID=CAMNT_0015331039 /DNA_START=29 /DNA_END=1152 /DNA_ORIENTATION=-